MENAKSFRDLYEDIWAPARVARDTARSNANDFICKCAKATKRADMTVRMWLSGKQVPDELAQEKLEEILGIPANVLFPEKNAISSKKYT